MNLFTLIRTKTPKNGKREVFEHAINQCESMETEVFENGPVFNNELHKTGEFESTKTDIIDCAFVIRWINVNGQKRMLFPPFALKN